MASASRGASSPKPLPSRAFLGITNTVDIGLNLTGEWDRRRIGEVLAQIRNAIELQPTLPIAYVALSQALSPGAGDLDAALAAAQQACRLSPNDAECFYILGAAQLQIGQIEIALGNLEQAMNRNPSPPAYLPAFHATAPSANRRFDEAIRVADDCLTRAPDFWRCHQDRIVALVELGRLPEARNEATVLQARVPRMTSASFGRLSARLPRTFASAGCGSAGSWHQGHGHSFAMKDWTLSQHGRPIRRRC